MIGEDIKVDLSPAQFAREIPFQTFAELRRRAPLFWYEPDQYWVVSSYDLLGEINRNPVVFSRGGPGGAGTSVKPGSHPLGDRMLIQMDHQSTRPTADWSAPRSPRERSTRRNRTSVYLRKNSYGTSSRMAGATGSLKWPRFCLFVSSPS